MANRDFPIACPKCGRTSFEIVSNIPTTSKELLAWSSSSGDKPVLAAKCKACGARFVPPRPLCIQCHATEMEWVEAEGEGKLAGFTCIYIVPPAMAELGYGRKKPYCVGAVDLAEGGRVDARIEGVDPTRPETIEVGMPLKVKYLHYGEDENRKTYLAFEPA